MPDKWEDLYRNIGSDSNTQEEHQLFPISDDDSYTEIMPHDNEQQIVYENNELTDRSPAHYQYKATYIMTAVKSGLMIIEQHRADMRIKYERYLQQMCTQSAHVQQVLFPEVVHFPASSAVILDKVLPELAKMGFDLSDLGQGSYSINGVPAGMEGIDYRTLLVNMVAEAVEKGSPSLETIHKSLALTMARVAAIPTGQILTNLEMESLVNELFACSNVNYTPDGKAILCILPQSEIEQLMG